MNNFSIRDIFQIKSECDFLSLALEVFRFQALENEVYKKYIHLLGIDINSVKTLETIPFLPIRFFKGHIIVTGTSKITKTFTSSGTTGLQTSRHHIADLKLYEHSFLQSFQKFYGPPSKYCFLALLPSYLERQGSSLIYMTDTLINLTKANGSGYYLHNHKELYDKIIENEQNNIPTFLFGVTYALLDFADTFSTNLNNTIIVETGGMKGKRKEMIREDVHSILKKSFTVNAIHSEYGMTELLSQAWSQGDGIFTCPPWMRIMIRDIYDPFSYVKVNSTGGINVIDLANIYSCSFIETSDLGKLCAEGSFEISGRFDYSDIRGCNLLV